MVFWLIWHFAFGILSSDSEFDSSSESDSENEVYMFGISEPTIFDPNEARTGQKISFSPSTFVKSDIIPMI